MAVWRVDKSTPGAAAEEEEARILKLHFPKFVEEGSGLLLHCTNNLDGVVREVKRDAAEFDILFLRYSLSSLLFSFFKTVGNF